MKNYKLIEAREKAGYTQTTFVEKIKEHVPMNLYSYCLKENGKRQFKVSEANIICEILERSYDELFK